MLDYHVSRLAMLTRQELKHAGYKVQALSRGLSYPWQSPSGDFHLVAGWLQPPAGRVHGESNIVELLMP